MNLVETAGCRLKAALQEVDRVKQSEFPYDHSQTALDIVESLLRRHLVNLDQFSDSTPPSLIRNECSLSLYRLFLYLPILGFILRSTNIRNAFEIYSPLLRLSRRILGPTTKLVLSSEWEYSPYTYSPITEIQDYVLIGFPASESSNPLLVPLAGHELGHHLWKVEHLSDHYQHDLETKVVAEITQNRWAEYHELFPQFKPVDLTEDVSAHRTWRPAYTWGILQAEEIFGDLLAVRVFHEAYLHAFIYFSSPGTPGQRAADYPNLRRRARHITEGEARKDEFTKMLNKTLIINRGE